MVANSNSDLIIQLSFWQHLFSLCLADRFSRHVAGWQFLPADCRQVLGLVGQFNSCALASAADLIARETGAVPQGYSTKLWSRKAGTVVCSACSICFGSVYTDLVVTSSMGTY